MGSADQCQDDEADIYPCPCGRRLRPVRAPPVVVKEVPQPYAYEYGVADDYSKANFRKTKTQDAAGNVGGSFTIALPDGRIQTTTYTADHTNGFVAEVTYSGEADAAPAPGYAPGRK